MKHSLSVQIKDDFHLGYKLEHDLEKMKKCEGVFAMKNEKGDFFLRSDCLKRQVTLGCHHKVHLDSSHWHSYDVTYDFSEKPAIKGIMGHPVTI